MKSIVLTIDYELHLGNETGSVKNCMIDPTNRLIEICEQNNSKMTVFWDILHYHKLMEIEHLYPEIQNDRKLIHYQIRDLVEKGHDIQLHIHPHWLDANYLNSKWKFTYERFSLHKLSTDKNEDNINTIFGCVKFSKDLMERIVKQFSPEYEVKTFRAGGYLIEPFEELSEVLIKNDILVDSSTCPNLSNINGMFSYDFINYPTNLTYKFKESPKIIQVNGPFLEIPIKTIYISKLRHLYFLFLRILKYRNLEKNRSGSGSGSTIKDYQKSSYLTKHFNKLFRSYYNQLTTDSCFKEKYNFLLKRSNDFSTQILHPKLLNEHMLTVLEEKLKYNKLKFVSINNFLKISNN